MRVALRLLALAALAAGAAANKNHTVKAPKSLGSLPAHALKYTYRANAAPYAPAGVGVGLGEPSIALSKDGKTLIFGAPTAPINSVTDTGFVSVAAYDAKRKTITETQRLTGTNPGGFFGAQLALDLTGKVLAVTEPLATVAGTVQTGQVNIYTKQGLGKQWVLSGTVTAGASSQALLNFGTSVAISKGGKILVVGAAGGAVNGTAFVFRRSNTLKPQGAQQAKQYTYSLVTRLNSPVVNDLQFGRVVSTTADGKHVAVSSPNAFLNAPPGRVWVYGLSKAQNAYVQTAAFTGPANTNFGIQVKLAPNGKTLAICDSFANSQQGAISIATYSAQQKTFALTQTNYLPTVNGYTFSFFCDGLAFSPDSKYLAVAESAAGQKGALWIMQSLRKPAWNITAGPITGPTATGSFLGRKGVALSGGAKVLAANSENPKSAWVFDRVRA